MVSEITLMDQRLPATTRTVFDAISSSHDMGPGLLSIHACLEKAGYKANLAVVHDAREVDETMKRFPNTEMVGISSLTCSAPLAYANSRYIRERYNVPVVMGGPHVTFMPEEALQHVDAVVIGEGEKAILALIDTVDRDGWPKRDKERIIGARFEEGGIDVDPKYRIWDMDELPIPTFYSSPGGMMPAPFNRLFKGILTRVRFSTSRGCPYACEFCQTSRKDGLKWRGNSAEYIVEALKVYKGKGANMVEFLDDNFMFDKKRMERFCELMEWEGLDLPWMCQGRADWIVKNEALFDRMVECGLKLIFMGVESSSQEILDRYHKGESVSDIERGLAIASKHPEVITAGSIILGGLDDTTESMNASIDFMKRLNPTLALFTLLTPLPGTPIHERLSREGRITDTDWTKYSSEYLVFDHPNIDNRLLQRRLYEAYIEFYDRPEWEERMRQWSAPDAVFPHVPRSMKDSLLHWVLRRTRDKTMGTMERKLHALP